MGIRIIVSVSAAAMLVSFAGLTVFSQQPQRSPSGRAPATNAQADRWMTELSNWGRWGKDDQNSMSTAA